jgi:predicted transcriptional regulator
MKTEYDFSQGKRGAIVPQTGKTRITIYIDDDVLETFRQLGDAAGKGYQTTMNEALRQYLDKAKTPIASLEPKAIDEETLRRIIQEELGAAK